MTSSNPVATAVSDYEVLSLIGEGSFGKVYKAKSSCTNQIVAYKVIGKGGRSSSELLTLRRECEIQQHLHHPNIIQMLDSFETENEIVVVTEYAHKGLHDILREEKVLSENEARNIICDLVSALYYLHCHRVLHRDLKPQNVLLDVNGVAKLCDFGFARTVNSGMQVLTSIKGTPLYMAPELMDENPYDHNADLWSLGCIAYEITVGHPPFTTTSLLQLVRMVKRDSIVWPGNLSETFLSFLKGLLQKDPNLRLSWPHLIFHPFVKDKIRVVENNPAALAVMSYTTPHIISRVSHNEHAHYPPMLVMPPAVTHGANNYNYCNSYHPYNANINPYVNHCHPNFGLPGGGVANCCNKQQCSSSYQPRSCSSGSFHLPQHDFRNIVPVANTNVDDNYTSQLEYQLRNFHLHNGAVDRSDNNSNNNDSSSNHNIDNDDDDAPDEDDEDDDYSEYVDSGNGSVETETEEWLEFLRNNIRDVMAGDTELLSEKTFLTMIITVLKNPRVDCSIVETIAKLLSLPFVIGSVSKSEMDQIRQLYVSCEIMRDLLFASKQVVLNSNSDSIISLTQINYKHLTCLEPLYVLISNLVYSKDEFVLQFHNFSIELEMASVIRLLLRLVRHNARIVMDVVTIILRVIKDIPDSSSLIENIIFHKTLSGVPSIDFHSLLTSCSDTLRTRTCILIILLVRKHKQEFMEIWNDKLTADLVSLRNSSTTVASVAKAAETLIIKSSNLLSE